MTDVHDIPKIDLRSNNKIIYKSHETNFPKAADSLERWVPPMRLSGEVQRVGEWMGGSQCRMSIIINGNVALLNLRKGCVACR